MVTIDGSDGGGQVLRLAVAVATLAGTSVTVENVRGARPDPGLRPQHVAAVEALSGLADATTDGVAVDSDTVVFDPGGGIGGDVSVEVGTAGSIPLIFDAVLPLGWRAEEPIRVRAMGGTHVKWAPTMDYVRSVTLPLLRSHNLEASVTNLEYGFYPEGGGAATLEITPSSIDPIERCNRGALQSIAVHSIETADLAAADVAERQIEGVMETLDGSVSVPFETETRTVESPSTGTAVLVTGDYENGRSGFTALGEPGRPAEDVGAEAADAFLEHHETDAAVDRYLADQLLVFLAIAGGTYTIPALTEHVQSARTVLSAFGHDITIRNDEPPFVVRG
jgi:RNA 3'-terminal phosphate cyclase (ATP)